MRANRVADVLGSSERIVRVAWAALCLCCAVWATGCGGRCEDYESLYRRCFRNSLTYDRHEHLMDEIPRVPSDCTNDGTSIMDCWSEALQDHHCHDSADLAEAVRHIEECDESE